MIKFILKSLVFNHTSPPVNLLLQNGINLAVSRKEFGVSMKNIHLMSSLVKEPCRGLSALHIIN